MKRLLLVLAAVVAVLAVLLWQRQSAPPELPFAKAERQRLESTLLTNGKVEPVEWAAARSQREGLVARITVTRGARVRADQVLAELDGGTAAADLASAEARAAQAKADLAVAERGRPAEITEIENGLERARKDLADAERDLAATKRLVEKNAAPKQDLRDLEDRAARARLQIESLERRRAALPAPADADAARARLRDAEAAAGLARRRLAQAQVRSPIDGVVYQLDARQGDWLQAGQQVALIGKVDRVRVIVFVDEPELGRIGPGMPVRIAWDALAAREWKGTVDKVPTQIVTQGTRQVGEVICLIENPQGDLLPGTNINATITSKVVERALTVPKEALRRESGQLGVFVLVNGTLAWKPVRLGAASVTRAEVLDGISEGDPVLLPSDVAVASGMAVKPQVR